MSLSPIDELPDSSRTWVFGADRPPGPDAAAQVLDRMRAFLEDWTAHRRHLRAALDWRHERFLIVAVDESSAAASGCSVDDLMGLLAALEEETGLGLVDTAPVWFRDPREDGRVRTVDRSRFRELAEAGEVGPATVVFDLTVDSLEAVRSGRWEAPAGETWHASLLPEPAEEAGAGGQG